MDYGPKIINDLIWKHVFGLAPEKQDPTIAWIINTADMCKLLSCLPQEGGLFAQDWQIVLLMGMVYSNRSRYEAIQNASKHNQVEM